MPRNITVTFADGSTHTYQNAPDDVTPDQVEARARKEFNKPVAHLDGGGTPEPRTFMGDVGQAFSDAGQAMVGMKDGKRDLYSTALQAAPGANGILAAGKLAGGLINAVGAAGGRGLTALGAAQYDQTHISPDGRTWYTEGDPNTLYPLQHRPDGKIDMDQFRVRMTGDRANAANEKTGENVAQLAAAMVPGGEVGAAKAVSPALEARPAEPILQTAKKVGQYFAKDKIDPASVKTALADAPEGALPYDLGGKNIKSMASAVAQSPGPGAEVMADAAASRQGQAVTRIKNAIGEAMGGKGNYYDTLDTLIANKRAAASKVMGEIGSKPIKLDDNSVLALRSDLAKGAIKDQANNFLASADPEDRAAGTMLHGLHDAVLDNPAGANIDLKSAQNVSRSLLEAGKAAYRSDPSKGRALTQLGKAIRDNARQTEPAYDTWLKTYGDASSVEDALQMGRNALGGRDKLPFEQLHKAVVEMSPVERMAYQKGLGEALFDAARRSPNGSAPMRDLLKTEDYADRVRLAFPNDKAFDEFANFAKSETKFAKNDNAIFGGSQTYNRAATAADINDNGIGVTDVIGHGIDAVHSPGKAAMGIVKRLAQTFDDKRGVLNNDMTNEILGKALSDPDKMNELIDALKYLQAQSPGSNAAKVALEALRSARPALVSSALSKDAGVLNLPALGPPSRAAAEDKKPKPKRHATDSVN